MVLLAGEVLGAVVAFVEVEVGVVVQVLAVRAVVLALLDAALLVILHLAAGRERAKVVVLHHFYC